MGRRRRIARRDAARPPTAASRRASPTTPSRSARRRSFEAIEERVKQLHGTIAVERRTQEGTQVIVTLPAVRDAAVSSARRADGNGYLLFVWSPAGYSLRELDGELPHVGEEFDEDGRMLVVNKIGASPLPGRHAPVRLLGRQGAEARHGLAPQAARRVLGGREAEHERLSEAARVAARRDAARVDARRPEAVDRRAVLPQHPRPLVDAQAADRVGDRGDHAHRATVPGGRVERQVGRRDTRLRRRGLHHLRDGRGRALGCSSASSSSR